MKEERNMHTIILRNIQIRTATAKHTQVQKLRLVPESKDSMGERPFNVSRAQLSFGKGYARPTCKRREHAIWLYTGQVDKPLFA